MVDILKSIGKFIGPDKINNLREVERKTYSGNPVYEVEFVDGRKVEYPEEILNTIISDEQGDWNSLREKVLVEPFRKIQMILLDSEMTLEDIRYLGETKIPIWVEDTVARCYKKFWNKERMTVTIRDANEYLSEKK